MRIVIAESNVCRRLIALSFVIAIAALISHESWKRLFGVCAITGQISSQVSNVAQMTTGRKRLIEKSTAMRKNLRQS